MGGPGLPFLLQRRRDPSDPMDVRSPMIGGADPSMYANPGRRIENDPGFDHTAPDDVEGTLHRGVFGGDGANTQQHQGTEEERILRMILGARPGETEMRNEAPVIPFDGAHRAFALDEIGNAGVGTAKPTWQNRLGSALQGAGESGALDPDSSNPIEAFLGAGLRTFGGVQKRKQAEQAHSDELDQDIIQQTLKGRRQQREDTLNEEKVRSQAALDRATAYKHLHDAKVDTDTDVGTVDVAGLEAELRAEGYPDMAAFVRANPNLVRKNPSSFTALVGKGSTTSEDEKAAEQARARVERAEQRATSQVLREENATDPETGAKKTYKPEDRVRRYNEVLRMFDRNYSQDSTLASTIKGMKKGAAGKQGDADAGQWADEKMAARTIVKGVPADIARRKLLNSGYTDTQINEILSGK